MKIIVSLVIITILILFVFLFFKFLLFDVLFLRIFFKLLVIKQIIYLFKCASISTWKYSFTGLVLPSSSAFATLDDVLLSK